jgi:hypothetical protein
MTANERTNRPHSWWWSLVFLLSVPGGVFLATPASWPDWGAMWLLVLSALGGSKWITWSAVARRGVSLRRQLAYWLAWPGLDASAFLAKGKTADPPGRIEWLFGWGNFIAGIAIMAATAYMLPSEHRFVMAWLGMTGIVLAIHHGLFKLLSCLWRSLGVAAIPLMKAPILATSVSDFWGTRWNKAFRDLSYQFLYRPSVRRHGPVFATWLVFGFSGLIHELAISVPARGGYGWPTFYFLLQAAAIFVEKSRWGKWIGLQSGIVGRVFAAVVLILPAPFLFHEPFRERIILPFFTAIGTIL